MIKINRYKTELDHGNAYWMARLSKAAYLRNEDKSPDEDSILSDLQAEDPRFISIHGASKDSAQAILVEHQLFFALVFRGTDETADWVDNISVSESKTEFGSFHKGFADSVDDIWEPLWQKYQELRKNYNVQIASNLSQQNRPLFLTGHSLGGAMATVAAARLLHMDHPFIAVYTFGQPRAVSRKSQVAFETMATGRVFRFQNNTDIVTRVPARVRGYTHVGKCVYISEESELYCDPGFWFRFLDAVDGAVESAKKFKLDLILDHNMDNYLAAIKHWNAKF